MTIQHYRLTLSEAISHYQQGDLTAKGLLHFYFKIRIAPGWTINKTPKQLCKELGIQKSAFYNGLSRLKAEGSITWQVPDSTKFSFTLPFRDCGKDSTNAENEQNCVLELSAIAENPSTITESLSAIAENPSTITENESLKVKSNKRFSDSSNSYSNSYSNCVSSGGGKHKNEPASLLDSEVASLPGPGGQQKNVSGESETIIGLPVQSKNLVEDKSSAPPVEKISVSATKRGSGRISPENYPVPEAIAAVTRRQSPGEILATRKAQLAGQRPPRPRPKFMYPDGEWLDNQGRLNRAFVDWMAADWKKSPAFSDKSIEQIRADVCSHFMFNHEKLAIRWDAYAAIACRKMENLEQRALTGFKMISVDAKEYDQIAGVRSTDPENAATDFTPESMTAPSPELERVLEGAGQLEERNQLFGQSIPKLSPSENLLESEENSSQKLAAAKIALFDTKKSQQNQEQIVEQLDYWAQDELEAEGVYSPEELAANQAKLSQMIAEGFNKSIPAEPKPKCKSGYRIVDGQVEVIPATITKEDRQQAQEMLAKKASKNNTPQSEDEEKQIEGFQKVKNAIAAIKSRTPMAKSRKYWADKIAESVKKAESLLTTQLTTQQYQINTNGYFIDEEGEF